MDAESRSPGKTGKWKFRERLDRIRRSIVERTETALVRFPIAVLAILAASTVANLEIADDAMFVFGSFVRLQMAFFAAAASSVAGALFVEARGAGWLTRFGAQTVSAIVAAAAVWYGLAWSVHAPALLLAITFAVPLAPYVRHGNGTAFWTFAVRILVGTLFAFSAVLLFVLGVVAILEMIGFLFEFDVGSGINEHIAVTAFSLIGPLFALGRIPASFEDRIEPSEGEPFVKGLALLAGWVSAPLALAAAGVLFLYGVKIVVTGTVPRGEIGWIVSFFALLTIVLRIAAEPIREMGGAALRLFCRIWPWLLLFPLALFFHAIFLRVSAEGLTIPRYYLGLEGVTAALLAILAIALRGRIDIRWLAGIPVLAIFLASFGPQGVAESVGRSQIARIAPLLEESRRIGGTPAELSQDERRELRSRIYALADAGQIERLSDVAGVAISSSSDRPYDQANAAVVALGLAATESGGEVTVTRFARPSSIDMSGFDRIAYDRRYRLNDGRLPASGAEETDENQAPPVGILVATSNGTVLDLQIEGSKARFPIDPDTISSQERPGGGRLARFRSEDGSATIAILPLAMERSPSGTLMSLDGDLFYRAEDWRTR